MKTGRVQENEGRQITGSCRSVRVLFAVFLLVAGMLCTGGCAATLNVGGDGYQTISDALRVAMPGDTILVESGTYHESLTIDVPVTISGVDTGGGLPVIMATQDDAAIVLVAGKTTIQGMVITGNAPCGIFVHSDDNVITGTTVTTSVSGTGIGICIYDADRTLVTGNHIGGQRLGIQISESDRTAVYYNEIDAVNGAFSSSPETSWVSPVTTYEYGGATFDGEMGNNWSGYSGVDTGGDGIGDEPYSPRPVTFQSLNTLGGESRGPYASYNKPLDQVEGFTGVVPVEDTSPLVAGIDAYVVTTAPTVPDNSNESGFVPRPDGAGGHFVLPWEPEKMVWPAFAFLGSLIIVGGLTFADRRSRHRSVLNRSRYTVPFLTAGYTVLAFLCSSAMFLAGFQSVKIFGNLMSTAPIVGGLAFLSVAGIILAASTAMERTPRYLLAAYLIAAGIVTSVSAALLLNGQGGSGGWPGGYVPLVLSAAAVLLGLYHRSRFITPQVSGDTDERTRIAHDGDPFDETRIMDSQLRDVYFPATLADRYRDVTFIGKGGLARVFRAVKRDDGAVVAVKVPISFDEKTGRIFLKEMKLWEGLIHPNIVSICSVNILPVPYVEMEYVPQSLAGVAMPLPPAEAAAIVVDIVRGLTYAHEHDIIHRDIKPHNILITEDGTAKITDWGLGTVMSDGHESSIVGFSIQYAAPEQIAPRRFGDADTRTDIYQTGIVFYELLTGRRPFDDGGLGEMTDAILGETPVTPSSRVPAAAPWDDIVMRCIAKEKGDRYPSAAALEESLCAVLDRL